MAATKKKDATEGSKETFPRLDDVEITKRHYQVLDQMKQSISLGDPHSLEWLVTELSV